MGEYWKPVNVTRHEFIHPHAVGCGIDTPQADLLERERAAARAERYAQQEDSIRKYETALAEEMCERSRLSVQLTTAKAEIERLRTDLAEVLQQASPSSHRSRNQAHDPARGGGARIRRDAGPRVSRTCHRGLTMINDWSDYQSGPFCRHWADPSDCSRVCAHCGHSCRMHDYGCDEDGCDCKEFVDAEESK